MINNQLVRLKEEQDRLVRQHMAVIDRIRDHKKALLDKRKGRPVAVDIVKIIEENRDERNGIIVESGRQSGD